MPKPLALDSAQGLQPEDAKEFEEWRACVIQRFEMACGGPQENDFGIRLERLAKLPPEVLVQLFAQALKVLHHEDQPSLQPVGRVQESGLGLPGDVLSPRPAGQSCVCRLDLAAEAGVMLSALFRQVEEGFQPEVSDVEDLHAFLHEANRHQSPPELRIGTDFRSDTRQQHGLAGGPGDPRRVCAGRKERRCCRGLAPGPHSAHARGRRTGR